jgi:hypothetical protein
MAQVVLVHGIAQEQLSADSLEQDWIPALAGGIRNAGFHALADRLVRTHEIDVRMAFWGDLFLRYGQQGYDSDSLVGDSEAEMLAMEWLERAGAYGLGDDAAVARQELAYVAPAINQIEQGFIGNQLRSAVRSLSRLRWFAPFGLIAAEKLVNRALGQVRSYFSNERIRSEMTARVHALITPSTQVLIGHSLGSVVAYEVVHQLSAPLPLMLTLGSPLGLRSIVLARVRPQPPKYPTYVQAWHNIAARGDIVAAEPNLRPHFELGLPNQAVFESHWEVDNGAEPHRANYYLNKALVGRLVAEVLSNSSPA